MLYEVITGKFYARENLEDPRQFQQFTAQHLRVFDPVFPRSFINALAVSLGLDLAMTVITSYSIHYTKLYEEIKHITTGSMKIC